MKFSTQNLLALVVLFALNPSNIGVSAVLPPLKNGDIVFQNTSSSARDAIMLASGTLYTHVGIVEIDKAGRPQVIEAVGPVRTISLDDWIRKGSGKRITIKRIKGLDEGQARKAVACAHLYMGRPYDYFYYETRDQIYCSELVHAAFKEGPNITVGREVKLRDLNIDTVAAGRLIAKRWRNHPLCKSQLVPTFETCYPLILNQTLVTPASIARDPQLELVYSTFGPDGD